jgi:hypothetical protein
LAIIVDVSVYEAGDRRRQVSVLNIKEPTDPMSNFFRNIVRPMFLGIEADYPNWGDVLPRNHVRHDCFKICGFDVSFAKCGACRTQIIHLLLF